MKKPPFEKKLEALQAEYEHLRGQIGGAEWQRRKEEGLAALADPDFWDRDERFVTLGEVEYRDRVEVGFGPDDWVEAELADIDSDETWRQWRLDWNAPPGEHVIAVRATDKDGFTQSPIPVPPAPDGAEGYHTISVQVV